MKKRFTILLLIVLAVHGLKVPAQNIDSLEDLLSVSQSTNKRIEIVVHLAQATIGIDDAKSDSCFNNAMSFYIANKQTDRSFAIMQGRIDKCRELGRTDMIVKTIDFWQPFFNRHDADKNIEKIYISASYAMLDTENYEQAAIFLMKSQDVAEALADTSTLIHNAFNLGYCYSMLNDDERAIEYYKKAERLTILSGDPHGLIDIYMNLGTAYEYMHLLDSALEYHFKSLKCSIESDDKSLLWLLYYNVAYSYFDYKKYDEALTNCRRAIEAEIVDSCPWPKNQAMLHSLLADIFLKTGQNDSAIANLELCGKYYHDKNDREGEAEALSRLGDICRTQKQYNNALECYNRALNICLTNNFVSLQKDIYDGLAKLYADIGKHSLAYQMIEKAYNITDSMLVNEKKQARMSMAQKIQAKEQIMHIEHEISQNRQKQQFEDERQSARHRMMVVILVIMSLIAVAVVLMMMHLRNINSLLKKANNEINMQKNQLEEAALHIRRRYRFLDLLINTVPTPLFFVKKDNLSVVGCNEAFEHLCGISREAIVGSTLDNLRQQTGIDWYPDKTRDFGTVSLMRFSTCQQRDVICYISELTDEGGYGDLASLVIVDVTELENIRRELCQSQKELEDALNVKTKFFSIFAHDLKNPFNGILGMTSLISEYYENYSPSEIKHYLSVINDSATHVYNMLTNLLDWAKSQTGMLEVNPSEFCITEPINDAISINRYNIELKQIKIDLRVESDYCVMADKNMVFTVFRNLIGNALKYTHTGGCITIGVSSENDKVLVSVSDNGIGISPENIQRLFDANHPITTPGLENEKGSGLGLIICNEFIRRNGGQIMVSSEVGKGTTFTFTLNRA